MQDIIEKKICIKYDGDNNIDAIDLATSILNFTKLTQKIGKDFIREDQEIKVSISTFQHGSVDTPIILGLVSKTIIAGGIIISSIPLDKTVSMVSDFLNIIVFLKGKKYNKIDRHPDDRNKIIVENCDGNTQIFNYGVIKFYGDATNYKYASKTFEPLKEESRTTGFILSEEIDGERIETVKIDKSEAEYFFKDVGEVIQQDISVVGVVYDMNTETFNGKLAMGTEKVSIGFRQIYNTPYFSDLVSSLKNHGLIKISGIADINPKPLQGGSMYKNIEITTANIISPPLFEDSD